MFKSFKYTALSEGVSFLILLVNMLIIKRIDFNLYQLLLKPIGMAHGILFMLYIVFAFFTERRKKWNFKDLSVIILASFLPLVLFILMLNT